MFIELFSLVIEQNIETISKVKYSSKKPFVIKGIEKVKDIFVVLDYGRSISDVTLFFVIFRTLPRSPCPFSFFP